MSASAKLHLVRLIHLVAEYFGAAMADKGIVRVGVEHEDEVREVVNETARKFLLLVETAFHLTALGDVHERALVSKDAAAVVADDGGGVQTNDGRAVLADQSDLAALNLRLALHLFLDDLALRAIDEDFRDLPFQEFFLGIIAEHAHEGGIGIHDGAIGRTDVDAFLERLEEFRETSFVFAERGNIAREEGNALDFVRAHHGVSNAVEVKWGRLILQANMDNAGTLAALHDTRHRTPHKLGAIANDFLDKFAQRPADNLLEGRVDEVGKAAVDGADLTIEGKSQQNVVERVDQVAIALLGLRDHLEKLAELFVAGRRFIALFHAAHEAAQFG